MSTIKYLAQDSDGFRIKAVEVERESAGIVWINGRRVSKRTVWEWYCDTWDEAQARLLDIAAARVRTATITLDYAKAELAKLAAMTPPNGGEV